MKNPPPLEGIRLPIPQFHPEFAFMALPIAEAAQENSPTGFGPFTGEECVAKADQPAQRIIEGLRAFTEKGFLSHDGKKFHLQPPFFPAFNAHVRLAH